MRRLVSTAVSLLALAAAGVAVVPAPAQAVAIAPGPATTAEYPTRQFLFVQGPRVVASGTVTFYNRSVNVSGRYRKPATNDAGRIGATSYAGTTELGSGATAWSASETLEDFSLTIPADVAGGASDVEVTLYGNTGQFLTILRTQTVSR